MRIQRPSGETRTVGSPMITPGPGLATRPRSSRVAALPAGARSRSIVSRENRPAIVVPDRRGDVESGPIRRHGHVAQDRVPGAKRRGQLLRDDAARLVPAGVVAHDGDALDGPVLDTASRSTRTGGAVIAGEDPAAATPYGRLARHRAVPASSQRSPPDRTGNRTSGPPAASNRPVREARRDGSWSALTPPPRSAGPPSPGVPAR